MTLAVPSETSFRPSLGGGMTEAIAENKRWYVVYTQHGREPIAAQELANQGLETLYPTFIRQRRLRRGLQRGVLNVETPLFPRYLFVAFDLASTRWRSVNGTRGVVRLFTQDEKPTPLPPDVADDLVRLYGRGPLDLKDQEPGTWRIDDLLRITADGPWMNLVGVCRLATKDRVRILLSLFGRPTVVSIPASDVSLA